MDIKVKQEDKFKKNLEVTLTKKELQPYLDKIYREYQKKVQLEGFRKGKVPISLIKKMFGSVIEEEAVDKAFDEIYKEVIRKENLKPVAPATLNNYERLPEGGVKFTLSVEVEPEIELKKYKDLTVEKEIYEIDDEDVELALQDIREQMAVMNTIEDGAKENHFIVADFQELDESGVPVIGKKFEDRYVQLKADDFTRELTDQLIGVKPGETRRVKLTVEGKDNHETKYYNVMVKEVKEKHLPQLDDELAKDLGNFSNLEELKEDLRRRLTEEEERKSRDYLRHAIIDEIIKQNPFDLPEKMVETALNRLYEDSKKQEKQEISREEFNEKMRANVIWNLKWMLIKEKIVELENIQVTDEDINQYLEKIARERNLDVNELKRKTQNPQTLSRVKFDLLEDKVIDFLIQHSKIKERKITKKDLEKARQLTATV